VIIIERDQDGLNKVWAFAEPHELEVLRSPKPEPEVDEPEA
jgi:hypothetical protein